jgi:glucosamine--fructose-6-phosphate aminotransferase (isomerizing)
VVSTKTFTSTAVAFALLGIHLGRIRDLSTADGGRLLSALAALPDQIASVIEREEEIAELAEMLVGREHAYLIGRSAGYSVAMEGALKLKEVSYLHAEAYPASELKHGPLALIAPETRRLWSFRATTGKPPTPQSSAGPVAFASGILGLGLGRG